MNQLGLPISLNVQMSLQNLIGNAQIKSTVNPLFSAYKSSEVYVYGGPGSGKTHLLQAVIFSAIEQDKAAIFVDCKEEIPDYLIEMIADLDWLSIDNIDSVGKAQQHLLFDLYNHARQENVNIIVSGFSLPSELNIMKDIKTRLNLAAVFQLESLNDEQTKEALNTKMREQNISIDEKIYAYLFKHYSRDISTLLGAIELLDKASMQAKQSINIPLTKKTLGILERQNKTLVPLDI